MISEYRAPTPPRINILYVKKRIFTENLKIISLMKKKSAVFYRDYDFIKLQNLHNNES